MPEANLSKTKCHQKEVLIKRSEKNGWTLKKWKIYIYCIKKFPLIKNVFKLHFILYESSIVLKG